LNHVRGMEVSQHSPEEHLARVASGQAGAFSHEQARSAGFLEHQIRYRVEVGRWIRTLSKTYVMAGAPESPRQKAVAAYLWGGPDCLLSHWVAASLLRLAPEPKLVDLIVPRNRRRPAQWVTVHRRAIDSCDVARLGALCCTNGTRTLIDLAPQTNDQTLEMMLEEGLRLGHCSVPRIHWRLDGLGPRHPGCGALRRLLEQRLTGGSSESALETLMGRVLKQMRQRGFPLPQRQFVVRLPTGTRARLDLAFPSYRVGLEGDGRRWHTQAAWNEDLRRENAFRQAGWDVRRFSWRDVTKDPKYLLDDAESALRLAGWRPYVVQESL